MTEKFLTAIRDYSMINPGDTVAVGVSGGADSMCLIDLLYTHARLLGITVCAAHVNHCLRGAESDGDEAFVREYCEKRKIPLRVLRVDINALRAEKKESAELCARNARYEFFASLGCAKTATAHTGSDAAETLLMNLSRGAGLNGMCSIPPVRGSVIRPLIYFTREETELYCREHGIEYVTDSSNLTDDYTRNKIRHRVVTELKSINPSFEKNAMRCIEAMRRDNDFLSACSQTVCESLRLNEGLDMRGLNAYHNAVKYRVIAGYLSERTGADVESRHIRALIDNSCADGFAVCLPGGSRAEIKNGVLGISNEAAASSGFEAVSFNKNSPFTIRLADFTLSFYASEPRKTESNEIAVDFYKINDIITIRPRKEGDKLTLSKRRCTKSLKKLFNEMKIPPEKRGGVPVVCDESGIIWCPAGGAELSRGINKNTEKYLIIKTEGGKND